MDNIDARKLSSEAQYHNRNQAIRLLDKGKNRREIAEIINVHYVTVCNWIRRYEKDGNSGLSIGQRGRRSGEDRKLTQAQETKLQQIICDKSPQQMKLPFALWTSVTIQDLAWNLWHIRIARRTVSTYLKRWGLPRKSPPSGLTNNAVKLFKSGLMKSIPLLKNAPNSLVARYTGVMRRAYVTSANILVAMHLKGKRRSLRPKPSGFHLT